MSWTTTTIVIVFVSLAVAFAVSEWLARRRYRPTDSDRGGSAAS